MGPRISKNQHRGRDMLKMQNLGNESCILAQRRLKEN